LTELQWFKADLHIHSVLSPCGGLEMSPLAVMERAKQLGIDIIAVTDHNSLANSCAYAEVALKMGIHYLFGVEIQTAEEIHLIALFQDATDAMALDAELYESLLPLPNDPDYFGDQVVVDADENILRFEERALLNSSTWSLEETLVKIREHQGFCFPAHVDAFTFSIIGQLGFIPDDLHLDAIGITARCDKDELLEKFPFLAPYPLVRSSDAHYLQDIGSGFAYFWLAEPNLAEIRLACLNQAGRKIWNELDMIKK
jgi:PHP family Zn ribbon phosphoesterase